MLQSIEEHSTAFKAAVYNQVFSELGQQLDLLLPSGNLQEAQRLITENVHRAGIKNPPEFVQKVIQAGYARVLKEKGASSAKDYLTAAGELTVGTAKVKHGLYSEAYNELWLQAFKQDEQEGENAYRKRATEIKAFELEIPSLPAYQETTGLDFADKVQWLRANEKALKTGKYPGISDPVKGATVYNYINSEVTRDRVSNAEETANTVISINDAIESGDFAKAEFEIGNLTGAAKASATAKFANFKTSAAPIHAAIAKTRTDLEQAIESLPDDTDEERAAQVSLKGELNELVKGLVNTTLPMGAEQRREHLLNKGYEPFNNFRDKVRKLHKEFTEAEGKIREAFQDEIIEGTASEAKVDALESSSKINKRTANELRGRLYSEKAFWRKEISPYNDTIRKVESDLFKLSEDREFAGYTKGNVFTGPAAKLGLIYDTSSKVSFMDQLSGMTIKEGEWTPLGVETIRQLMLDYNVALDAWRYSKEGIAARSLAVRSGDINIFKNTLEFVKRDYGLQLKRHMKTTPLSPFKPSTESFRESPTNVPEKAEEGFRASPSGPPEELRESPTFPKEEGEELRAPPVGPPEELRAPPTGPPDEEDIRLLARPISKREKALAKLRTPETEQIGQMLSGLVESEFSAGMPSLKNPFSISKVSDPYGILGEANLDPLTPDFIGDKASPALPKFMKSRLGAATARNLTKTGLFRSNRDLEVTVENLERYHPYPMIVGVLSKFANKDPEARVWLDQVRKYNQATVASLQNVSEEQQSQALIDSSLFVGFSYKAVLAGHLNNIPINGARIPYQVLPLFDTETELDEVLKNSDTATQLLRSLGLPIAEGENVQDSDTLAYFAAWQREAIRRINN